PLRRTPANRHGRRYRRLSRSQAHSRASWSSAFPASPLRRWSRRVAGNRGCRRQCSQAGGAFLLLARGRPSRQGRAGGLGRVDGFGGMMWLVLLALPGGVFWGGWGREGLEKDLAWLDLPCERWSATRAMIRDHVWWGVGPGNFSRSYPRYMSAEAADKAAEPQ